MAIETHDAFREILKTISQDGGFDSVDGLLTNIGREQGLGNQNAIFSDLFLGFNRRTQGNQAPANRDRQGLSFFTRPDLNLAYDNVALVNKLTPLLSTHSNTYQRAIRVMLYPDGHRGGSNILAPGIFDERQAFMSLLSNTLTSMSGWPGMVLNAYNTPEGMAKETWIMNDSIAEINGRFDISCTFRNVMGDPVTGTFFPWLVYEGAVYTNRMVPLKSNLVAGRIDYTTRIYRFVLDHQNRFIQKWACCGAAFPYSLDIGAAFNYDREEVYNPSLNDINVSFVCVGAVYNDPRIFRWFNTTAAAFNPMLLEGRDNKRLIKIPYDEEMRMNYRGYPWVNERTGELEWWATPEQIQYVATGY
ncbi:hypothetical protein ACLPJK_26365 [Pseudomonas aeruginosa]|uniref:hypothetical protein n=1 Tax=Pseudomonas aeruginosa TaxID=287 RepID=UPI003D2AC3BA